MAVVNDAVDADVKSIVIAANDALYSDFAVDAVDAAIDVATVVAPTTA